MKIYIRSAYDRELLTYVPKMYKKYVESIHRCEKEWDERTHRWYVPIEITWNINGDVLTQVFQTANYMRFSIKEGQSEDLIEFFNDHGIEY